MQRVLLIRLTALGDVILVEPVARALKERFEGVQVDLVTEAKSAPLMATAASIDRVITYDRHGEDSGWAGLSRVESRLGDTAYDLVVDLQGKLRTRILARRVKAHRRLRYRKRTFLSGVLSLFGWDPPLTGTHAVDLYLAALQPLGIKGGVIRIPKLALPKPETLSQSLKIGLSAGTTHPTKQWPAEHFAELARRLSEQYSNVSFTLIGGPKDLEILTKIRACYENENLSRLDTTSMSIEVMSATIAGLDLFVGVDSGPTHIAAALGIPVVALFGPTSPTRWGPRGAPHERVSLDLLCAPCSNIGGAKCPKASRDHACMRELGAEQVQSAVLRVLNAKVGAA